MRRRLEEQGRAASARRHVGHAAELRWEQRGGGLGEASRASYDRMCGRARASDGTRTVDQRNRLRSTSNGLARATSPLVAREPVLSLRANFRVSKSAEVQVENFAPRSFNLSRGAAGSVAAARGWGSGTVGKSGRDDGVQGSRECGESNGVHGARVAGPACGGGLSRGGRCAGRGGSGAGSPAPPERLRRARHSASGPPPLRAITP